jgi:uncharacterized repeat protein (TIGR03803 family)
MRLRRHYRILPALAVFCFLSILTENALAATETVLHSFTGGTDGAYPVGIFFDASGHIFGVTNSGGNNECNSELSGGCGVVFDMTLDGGSWSESVIHAFDQSTDGGNPVALLTIDANGKLYGCTEYYGEHGSGSVFQLTPSGGTWSDSILDSFPTVSSGFDCAGLVFDPAGRLFGVAFAGGTNNEGLVFQLKPKIGGMWKEADLYNFIGGNNDGDSPSAPPVFCPPSKSRDILYGTTYEGGPHLGGTVYEMQKIKGKWTETPIYFFQGLPFGKSSDGTNPTSSVVFDQAGNLYGTTDYGGAAGVGTVYELSPNGKGGWTESVLYEFKDGADGGHPSALILDDAGNLYGVTSGHKTYGSVYELSPPDME